MGFVFLIHLGVRPDKGLEGKALADLNDSDLGV
jgi:hypothetical protein